MGAFAQILQRAHDATAAQSVIGAPSTAVAPAAVAPVTQWQAHNLPGAEPIPLVQDAGFTYPVGSKAVALNVDRSAAAPAVAPASSGSATTSLAPVATPVLSASPSWLGWLKQHWPWLAAALLVLLVIVYSTKRGRGTRHESGFRPSRMVKGSPEAKAHMAALRNRKRKG